MSSLFCCGSAKSYKPGYLDHEAKFNTFMGWAEFPKESSLATVNDGNSQNDKADLTALKPKYVVQLVRQVNYGPLESTRYFAHVEGQDEPFIEVTENDLIQANFKKLNSYKNFKCDTHDKFFELNLYQKDPANKHHWRRNVARPSDSIDL
ncbi:hypothetical protein F4818DRAFT_438675 [Hypoxylon cercidicola]|nr:hypothetical protein F4818DRAFT_438675 [Hypoxylon cercidicola]